MEKREVPDRVKRVQSLRQSGAAGKQQDKRTKRARTRQAKTQAARKDQDDE